MIEIIFTIDYEIYGNGEGSLRDLVYEPAARLIELFYAHKVRFIPFIEVSELEIIEDKATDPAIDAIKQQIKYFHQNGFELGLHLHPQWYNARRDNGAWLLDYKEYNLCTLTEERTAQIIERALKYMRSVLGVADFTPLSFRAGNWLFQPTYVLAKILAEHGIKIDSSVFKGGLQHQHHLDYRPALQNGYFWRFKDDVNQPDDDGKIIEIPIYTEMVPPWQMATRKRLGLQQKAAADKKTAKEKVYRLLDIARSLQPLKFDFCRMTMEELTGMIDRIIQDDLRDPMPYKPIVAIGHTKDLIDFETVESFLSYLRKKEIRVATFKEIYNRYKMSI